MSEKDLLRFSTAGQVDDGKSTLIGRMLYDSGNLPLDQIALLEKKARAAGRDQIDLAQITDGLKAEREQGITIDVAYRYFSTRNRKFIIADTPGHSQYTRNMVTGTSTADASLILIDARKGITEQSKRHSLVASLLGVEVLVVCVNKIDLVEYSESVFKKIQKDFLTWADKLNIREVRFIPVSALHGDNVVINSNKTKWYQGKNLLDTLNTLQIKKNVDFQELRVSVQYVEQIAQGINLPLVQALILNGELKKKERVINVRTSEKSNIRQLNDLNGLADVVTAPYSAKILLDSNIQIERGDLLTNSKGLPKVSLSFTANLCWMGNRQLALGEEFILQLGVKQVPAIVEQINYVIDPETLNKDQLRTHLQLNDIAEVIIRSNYPIVYDRYQDHKNTGSFILIDYETSNTVAGGMIL